MPVRPDRRRPPSGPDPARLVVLAGVVAGLAHLLVPDRLLDAARAGYDRVLAVRFRPRDGATRRVRLVGLAMLAASTAVELLYRDRRHRR